MSAIKFRNDNIAELLFSGNVGGDHKLCEGCRLWLHQQKQSNKSLKTLKSLPWRRWWWNPALDTAVVSEYVSEWGGASLNITFVHSRHPLSLWGFPGTPSWKRIVHFKSNRSAVGRALTEQQVQHEGVQQISVMRTNTKWRLWNENLRVVVVGASKKTQVLPAHWSGDGETLRTVVYKTMETHELLWFFSWLGGFINISELQQELIYWL